MEPTCRARGAHCRQDRPAETQPGPNCPLSAPQGDPPANPCRATAATMQSDLCLSSSCVGATTAAPSQARQAWVVPPRSGRASKGGRHPSRPGCWRCLPDQSLKHEPRQKPCPEAYQQGAWRGLGFALRQPDGYIRTRSDQAVRDQRLRGKWTHPGPRTKGPSIHHTEVIEHVRSLGPWRSARPCLGVRSPLLQRWIARNPSLVEQLFRFNALA